MSESVDDILGDDGGMGHNSVAVSRGQLKAVVERIERLEDEKKEASDQIREVFSEAKANGYDVKTLRTIIKLRKKPPEQRTEEEAMLELYMHALGMI